MQAHESPAWMKDNNDMLQGGKLKPEFYDSWAMYYTKFIKAYEKEGASVGYYHPERAYGKTNMGKLYLHSRGGT
ncbi:MAG: hypothetical protein U0T11_05410 [Chitinophagaceae bacterium]